MPAAGFWLPADSDIHRRLLTKIPLDPQLQQCRLFGIDCPVLFPVQADATLAFDLPAAALFFFSLHEQWSSTERDAFDRFPASASLLGRSNLLDVPVVSRWGRMLREALRAAGLPVSDAPRFDGKTFSLCMTHDIDYLSKYIPGLLFREIVKNFVFNRRSVSIADRMRRLREYLSFGISGRDPYIVSIDRMLEGESKSGMRATWLFKAGGNDKRDVTYNVRGSRAVGLIGRIRSAGHEIGVHPSFNAYIDAAMFGREAGTIAKLAGGTIRSVRQHYLRFSYPETWRIQAEMGCEVDSTLGFAEFEGFRNGLCHPFLPFDLERNEAMPLWELPLTVMDGTLAGYRGLDTGRALDRIRALWSIVEAERGCLVLLFHNTAFDEHDFPGWGRVFDAVCGDAADCRDVYAETMSSAAAAWAKTAGFGNPGEICQVINSEP